MDRPENYRGDIRARCPRGTITLTLSGHQLSIYAADDHHEDDWKVVVDLLNEIGVRDPGPPGYLRPPPADWIPGQPLDEVEWQPGITEWQIWLSDSQLAAARASVIPGWRPIPPD
jgi:hypothetical protein